MSGGGTLRVLPDDLEQEDSLDVETPPERVRDYDIDPPITFAKKPFSRLHLCEPTGAQIQKAEFELAAAQNIFTMRRYQITLIAAVAKVPREVVEAMRVTQIEECFEFLGPLLAPGPRTGET
jgi:hypothetical protein